MPHFSVSDAGRDRFEGDFQVIADAGYTPTERERAYLDKLEATLSDLADEDRKDPDQYGLQQLLTARRRHREEAAAKLREIADRFASGAADADMAINETDEVAKDFADHRPNIVIKDIPPEDTRFAGDFSVACEHFELDAVATYFERIKEILDDLSSDETKDRAAKFSEARLGARRERRKEAAATLRRQADEFLKGELALWLAARNAPVIQGMYVADRDRLARPLFEVTLEYAPDEFVASAGPNEITVATGLDIKLTSGLPPPEDAPSQEKRDLYVEIGSATTVISTVCQRIRDRAERIKKRWWWSNRKAEIEERRRAQRLLDQYTRKLADIARLGLEQQHTGLAKLALNELRSEFVAQQAGRIKNTYIRSLGVAAGIAAGLLLLAYVVLAAGWIENVWLNIHKTFLLAAAGAAIGTWLSFSIRRVQLTFDDLAILEEDLLDPSVRVIFVIALTLTACLLFWTSAMNIEIGNLKTNSMVFQQNGSVAMLIGLFAGVAERALATAISGRATTFAQGIGGG